MEKKSGSLSDLFPRAEERHEFTLGLRKQEPELFFARSPEHQEILQERKSWLRQQPALHAALLPEGEPLLREAMAMATSWGACDQAPSPAPVMSGEELLQAFAGRFEHDFLLLKPESEHGEAILRGGCVCFPSSWRLTEKVGKPLGFIHSVVPGLNKALGRQVGAFMDRIRPGVAWTRANWGLAASPERNHHPDRHLPRLSRVKTLGGVWMRIERQALLALPRSGGVLFCIGIEIHNLADLQAMDPEAARGLRQALRTMPESLLHYKQLLRARADLIDLLRE